MAVLIDTSLLIEYERDAAGLGSLVEREEGAVSVVTVSELLHGAHRATGSRRDQRFARVNHLLAPFIALPVTEEVARVHAEAWAALEARGEIVGAHDLWIAATALANNLGLATLDVRDFSRVPGLRLAAL